MTTATRQPRPTAALAAVTAVITLALTIGPTSASADPPVGDESAPVQDDPGPSVPLDMSQMEALEPSADAAIAIDCDQAASLCIASILTDHPGYEELGGLEVGDQVPEQLLEAAHEDGAGQASDADQSTGSIAPQPSATEGTQPAPDQSTDAANGTVQRRGAARPALAAAPGRVPFPQECMTIALDKTLPGTSGTGKRTWVCAVKPWTVVLYSIRGNSAVVDGTAKFNLIQYYRTNTRTRTVQAQIGVQLLSWTGKGTEVRINAQVSEQPGCKVASRRDLVDAQSITDYGSAELTSNVTRGKISDCFAKWNPRATATGYPLSSDFDLPPFHAARCDMVAMTATPGCVVSEVPPTMTYGSSTPTIARHIRNAQQQGLRGTLNNGPLHRTTSITTSNLNGSRACAGRPTVRGRSCDEYPFRSTEEGLAQLSSADYRARHDSARRSFSFCSWPGLNRSTTGLIVTVCMVPVAEQTAQSTTIRNFYRDWRVLNHDAFYVSA